MSQQTINPTSADGIAGAAGTSVATAFTSAPGIATATEFVSAPGPSRLRRFFAFPETVNEHAARFTAGVVVLLALAALFLQSALGGLDVWLVGAIAAGFVLRTAFGPRISPVAILSVRVLAPLAGAPKSVPGAPKRFAQAIGAVLSTAAFVLLLAGVPVVAWVLLAALAVAASLEAFAGLCLGCLIFGWLQRRGVIPAGVCLECAGVGR